MDYYEIWNKMEWDVVYTAKDLLVAPASLLAMERRGMVKLVAMKPNRYIKKRNAAIDIAKIVEDKDAYFSVWKVGEKMGMMCRFKNNTIVDCWDKPYDASDVERILYKGKEVKLYD